jgi:hypothetical protein
MKRRTSETIKNLLDHEWFSSVGKPTRDDIIVVNSWKHAAKHCVSSHWLDTITEADNLMREEIVAKSPKRLDKWNDISDELREFVTPRVRKKIVKVVEEYELPERFEQMVVLVIAGVGIEQEYGSPQ